jgi:hypothetical protein
VSVGVRLVRLLLGFAMGLVLAVMLTVGGLSWRLSRGPLDVTGAVRLVAARVKPDLAVDRVIVLLAGRELHVIAAGLHTGGDDGPAVARVELTVAARPLLRGRIRPHEVLVDSLRLHMRRRANGTVAVDGLPPSVGPAADPLNPRILARLTHVAVHDASIDLTDEASGQTGQVRDAVADLQRDAARGVSSGYTQATLTVGGISTVARIDATRLHDDGAVEAHATLSAINPALVSRLAPGLAPLGVLDATLGLAADVEIGPDLTLHHAALHVQSGPGRAFLPAKGGGTSPADFVSLALDANGDLGAVTLTGLRLVLAPPSGQPQTTLVLTGDASRTAGRAVAHLHLGLDHALLADLPALWPVGTGGGARPWLAENVVGGSAHDGHFDFTLETAGALDDVALTEATGSVVADDVTLYWLRPVPPITRAHTVLTLISPDALTIVATGGRQGPLVIRDAEMRIWGMSTKDQSGKIEGDVAGSIPAVFALLRHPRLKLLSVHPLPIANPTGDSVSHLTVTLPLREKVSFEMVGIHAVSQLTHVQLGAVAAGKDFDHGTLAADITQDGLTLTGTARVAGLPATLGVDMDFRAGPASQVVQHVTMSTRADDRALAKIGLDTIGLLTGTVSANLDYAERRDGHSVLQGTADLKEAALSTPIGWSKPVGPPASIEARAELDHGKLTGFDGLRAEGPGLSIAGHGELINGRPSVLHIERAVIGRTSVAGMISFPNRPGEALRAVLSGPRLDLSGPLSSKTTFEPSTPDLAPPGRPYAVDLRFDRVMMGKDAAGVGPVSLTASGDARRIAEAHMVSTGPEHVVASIVPKGETRHLSVAIGDLGLLLHQLGIMEEIDQAGVDVEGDFDDRRAGSPLAGTAYLSRFGVRGATILGKLLQGMTLYGLMDALRGPGLVFDQLYSQFRLTGSLLDLEGGHASSSSLGVTAYGQVDFRRRTMNLQGTIVPAYAINTLPGRLPLIGRLFSPERGGGLFAATFSVTGPFANPAVGVNPLSALTPGALRGLFGLFN